jgi:mannose-6-phosphate isomerase-like protein (cupin superfamily)
MDESLDFGAIFRRLEAGGERQHHALLNGIDVRLVRVEGGAPGRWDVHEDTPETVIVWSGSFDVAFKDHIVSLGAGQCCVVPTGAEHRGASATGAEVILFKSAPANG